MSTGEDEPSSSVNGRLRPRRAATSSQERRKPNTPNKSLDPPEPAPLLCPYCDKTFGSKQAVTKHVLRYHLSSQHASVACLFCSHSETDAQVIIRHMVDRHPNQYFACLDCYTRLPSTADLAEHKLLCDKQKLPYRCKLRRKGSIGSLKKTNKTLDNDNSGDSNDDEDKDYGFNGMVISCELKPGQVHDEADIEDKIITNLILPPSKTHGSGLLLEKSAVLVLDDVQWNKRIPPNFSFHNTDADQILSRLGVVHRSPRVGDNRRDWLRFIDDPAQKFEKCFDTSFYSRVASNVHENLTKFLDGSFNFNPDCDTIKTRKSKNSVVINTAEGFPILLSYEQFARGPGDGYLPRAIAPKHKWKWDSVENDRHPLTADQIKRDSHTNNCIISFVSSLDIWTQLCMKKKYQEKFGLLKKSDKNSDIASELKEILESRELPSTSKKPLMQIGNTVEDRSPCLEGFPGSLGLVKRGSKPAASPAVLSGEWSRPRCYVCSACGARHAEAKQVASHVANHHANATVQHFEVVGEMLLNNDILKHLYVPPIQIVNRTRPLRGFRECTKCKKSVSLEDLHQHMLDCAGDTPTVRRKVRQRPFGVRRRRPRLPDNTIRKKMRNNIRTRHRQKAHRRQRPKIRSEVGDAETIRKMLADLPAKRNRVLLNPIHALLRSGKKHDIKRNKLMMKRRASEDSKIRRLRSSKEPHAGGKKVTNEVFRKPSSKDDDDDKPLKSVLRNYNDKKKQTESIKRATVMKRPKKNAVVDKKVKRNPVEKQPLSDMAMKTPVEDLSVFNTSRKIDLNDPSQAKGSYRTRGGGNSRDGDNSGDRGDQQNNDSSGNSQRNDNNSNSNGNDNNGSSNNSNSNNNNNNNRNNNNRYNNNSHDNNNRLPQRPVPLKHSIASLTANSETHDKSVQFHQMFLVQQECNNIADFGPGHQLLFENEAVVTRLDKPPIHYQRSCSFNASTTDNPQKNKPSKPIRKGLNDCIAMLKNKLDPETSGSSSHFSVQCGLDEPIGAVLVPTAMPLELSTTQLSPTRPSAIQYSPAATKNTKDESVIQDTPNIHIPPAPVETQLPVTPQTPSQPTYVRSEKPEDIPKTNEKPRRGVKNKPVPVEEPSPKRESLRQKSRRSKVEQQYQHMLETEVMVPPPEVEVPRICPTQAGSEPVLIPAPGPITLPERHQHIQSTEVVDADIAQSESSTADHHSDNLSLNRQNEGTTVIVRQETTLEMSPTESECSPASRIASMPVEMPPTDPCMQCELMVQGLPELQPEVMPIEIIETFQEQPTSKSVIVEAYNDNFGPDPAPLAHASTSLEPYMPAPLDLSGGYIDLRPIEPQPGCSYMTNYSEYETLDLSNRRCDRFVSTRDMSSYDPNAMNAEIVDLRVNARPSVLNQCYMDPRGSFTIVLMEDVTDLSPQYDNNVPTDLSIRKRASVTPPNYEEPRPDYTQTLPAHGDENRNTPTLSFALDYPTDLSGKLDDLQQNSSTTPDTKEELKILEEPHRSGEDMILNKKQAKVMENKLKEKLIIEKSKRQENSRVTEANEGNQTLNLITTPTVRNQSINKAPTSRDPSRSREIEQAITSVPHETQSLHSSSYPHDFAYHPTNIIHTLTNQNSGPYNEIMIADQTTPYSVESLPSITVEPQPAHSHPRSRKGKTSARGESTRPVYTLSNVCIPTATTSVYTPTETSSASSLSYGIVHNTLLPPPPPPLPPSTTKPTRQDISEATNYSPVKNVNAIGSNNQTTAQDESLNDIETAKKIAMLPKELVEILGTMPADHRRQLLDVLPQYVSTTTATCSPSIVTHTMTSATTSIIDSNTFNLSDEKERYTSICDLAISEKEVSRSDLFNTSRVDLPTPPLDYVSKIELAKRSSPSAVHASNGSKDLLEISKNTGRTGNENIVDTVDSQILNRIIDLTDDDPDLPIVDIASSVKLSEKCPLSVATTPQKTSDITTGKKWQKLSNEKTASLRAVRIKTPLERQKHILADHHKVTKPAEETTAPFSTVLKIDKLMSNDIADASRVKTVDSEKINPNVKSDLNVTITPLTVNVSPNSTETKILPEDQVNTVAIEIKTCIDINFEDSVSQEKSSLKKASFSVDEKKLNSDNFTDKKSVPKEAFNMTTDEKDESNKRTDINKLEDSIILDTLMSFVTSTPIQEHNSEKLNVTETNIKLTEEDDSEDDISLAAIVKQKQIDSKSTIPEAEISKIDNKSNIASGKKNRKAKKMKKSLTKDVILSNDDKQTNEHKNYQCHKNKSKSTETIINFENKTSKRKTRKSRRNLLDVIDNDCNKITNDLEVNKENDHIPTDIHVNKKNIYNKNDLEISDNLTSCDQNYTKSQNITEDIQTSKDLNKKKIENTKGMIEQVVDISELDQSDLNDNCKLPPNTIEDKRHACSGEQLSTNLILTKSINCDITYAEKEETGNLTESNTQVDSSQAHMENESVDDFSNPDYLHSKKNKSAKKSKVVEICMFSEEFKNESASEKIVPLRRSRRGKSLFVEGVFADCENSLNDNNLEYVIPVTRKQLIFTKLLLDDNIFSKLPEEVPDSTFETNEIVETSNGEKEVAANSNDEENKIIKISNGLTNDINDTHKELEPYKEIIQPHKELKHHKELKSLKTITKTKKSQNKRRKNKKKKSVEVSRITNEINHDTKDLFDTSLQNSTENHLKIQKEELNTNCDLKTELPIQPIDETEVTKDTSSKSKKELSPPTKRKSKSDPSEEPGPCKKQKKSKHLKSSDKHSKLEAQNNLPTAEIDTSIPSDTSKVASDSEQRATMCYSASVAPKRTRSKSVVKSLPIEYDPYDIDNDELAEKIEPVVSKNKSPMNGKIIKKGKSSSSTSVKKSRKTTKSVSSTSNLPKNRSTSTNETTHIDNNNKESASDSDSSSKSDVPLKKYAEEKEKKLANQNFYDNYQPVAGCSTDKNSKPYKSSRRTHTVTGIVETTSAENESEEQLRAEQFMESFGFFSQRKPRKSNLLASKKISETFHIIANESEDSFVNVRERQPKRTSQNENRKSSETAAKVQHPPAKKGKQGRKKSRKNSQLHFVPCYCNICNKEFRRPDNYLRHQMTLHHILKLSEIELKPKPAPVPEEKNFLLIYKHQLERLKHLKERLTKKKFSKSAQMLILPTLEDILINVNKTVREQQLARLGLSRDEALFLDCCELLKESNIDGFTIPNEATIAGFEEIFRNDCFNDGEIDSLTAKIILESDEVRNLENDLISGLKEANAGTFCPRNYKPAEVAENNLETPECSSPNESNDVVKPQKEKEEKAEEDVPEIKEKMYPDVTVDDIDMFEDKFDKIKRKCRSTAAAAKHPAPAVEPTICHKARKKTEKRKTKKALKKNLQNTVLTKGALKGYDAIKVSIPTSDINLSAIITPLDKISKKKKKPVSKKKKQKKEKTEKVDKIEPECNGKQETDNGKEATVQNVDVYEFMDNEDAELFEFRPSTLMERFKIMNTKDGPSTSKAAVAVEEPDKSSCSASDGDDFVYMSDDYMCSDEETENSLTSHFSSAKHAADAKKIAQPMRRKDAIEKNAVMGKIFKNNAVRAEKKPVKPKESTKPKANLDQLFDSLLEEEPTSSMLNDDTASPKKDDSQFEVFDSLLPKKDSNSKPKSDSFHDDFALPQKLTASPSKKIPKKRHYDVTPVYDINSPSTSTSRNYYDYGPSTSAASDLIFLRRPHSPKKTDNYNKNYESTNRYSSESPEYEKPSNGRDSTRYIIEDTSNRFMKDSEELEDQGIGMDDGGVARQRARRKCTVGKQNVLAESWSSESEAEVRGGSVDRRRARRRERPLPRRDQELEQQPGPSTVRPRSRAPGFFFPEEPAAGPEHPPQHGWIVGDSHKKLVTMLAHAKGRKRNHDEKRHLDE